MEDGTGIVGVVEDGTGIVGVRVAVSVAARGVMVMAGAPAAR